MPLLEGIPNYITYPIIVALIVVSMLIQIRGVSLAEKILVVLLRLAELTVDFLRRISLKLAITLGLPIFLMFGIIFGMNNDDVPPLNDPSRSGDTFLIRFSLWIFDAMVSGFEEISGKFASWFSGLVPF